MTLNICNLFLQQFLCESIEHRIIQCGVSNDAQLLARSVVSAPMVFDSVIDRGLLTLGDEVSSIAAITSSRDVTSHCNKEDAHAPADVCQGTQYPQHQTYLQIPPLTTGSLSANFVDSVDNSI